MIKKYISIMLAVILCLSCMPITAEETVQTDENINLLYDLGFAENDELERMTKLNFAKIAARLGGIEIQSSEDAKEAVETTGFLSELKDSDLSKGIMYASAARILVSLLGYEQEALAKDKSVSGYMAMASSLGICSGIKLSFGDELDSASAAKMFVNSLKIPYMQIGEIAEDGTITYEKSNENILNVLHKIYKKTGVVTATGSTGLYTSEKAAGKGRAVIGGISMKTSKSLADFLGSTVTYYYKDDDDTNDKILLYTMPKDESLKIYDGDIVSADFTALKYEEEDRVKTAKIAENAAYIYNGVACPDLKKEDIVPESGYVILSSENGESPYSTVIIWDFKNILVNDFDYINYVITDYENNTYKYDIKSYKEVSITDENGNPLYALDIKYGKLCSVAESEDKSVLKIIVCQNKLSGTVTATDGKNITIDETEYTLSDDLANKKDEDTKRLKTGMTGTFYINCFGKIAKIIWTEETGIFVGYLFKAAMKDAGIDSGLECKILTQSGQVEAIKCADKVSVNSQPKISSDKIYNIVKNANGGELKQLIRYKLNSKHEITEIDTAYTEAPESGESEYTLKRTFSGSGYYKSSQNLFSGNAPIESGTVVFNVPALEDGEAKDEDYSVITGASMQGEKGYKIDAYAIGDKLVAKYLVNISLELSSAQEADESDQDFMVIKKITSAVNEANEPVKMVEGYHKGILKVYLTKEENTLPADIKAGDSVFLKLSKEKIIAVSIAYKAKEKTWHLSSNPTSPTYYLNQYRSCFGRALKCEDGFVKIVYGADPKPAAPSTDLFNAARYSITLVDLTKGDIPKVTQGSVSDIISYDKAQDKCSTLVVFSSYADPRYMVVYKEFDN